jgi:hypothetical protein
MKIASSAVYRNRSPETTKAEKFYGSPARASTIVTNRFVKRYYEFTIILFDDWQVCNGFLLNKKQMH